MATAASMDYVQKIFIAYLGRGASTEALEYWGNAIDADEEQGKADFFANIWGSDAAVALYAGMDTEAIITQIFQNAFERDPAAEGIAYWEGEIANGNVNSVSLAAAIVDSAGALDLVVYDYKTEAGNYYRTEMDDNGKDFSADQSLAAVQDVEGPASLQDSKDATDAIAGVTALVDSLTTADNDVMAMTADDDVITATHLTMDAGDEIEDASTEDSDTLTVDATADFTFGTVTNVETINVDLEKVNGAAFQIDVGGVTGTGSTMHITTAADTSLGGAPISGETKVELIGDLSVDVTTTDVTALTAASVTNDAITITGDANLAAVTVTSVSGENDSVSVGLGNANAVVTVDLGAGDADSLGVTASGAVTVNATDVESLELTGNGAALSATVTGLVAPDLVVSGDQSVTITGNDAVFDGAELTDTSTAGTTSVVATEDDFDASGLGVLSGTLDVSDLGVDAVTLLSGNTVDVGSNPLLFLTVGGNDSAADEITINADGATAGVLAAGFETVNITGNDAGTTAVDHGCRRN